jgi:hypothetical protein
MPSQCVTCRRALKQQVVDETRPGGRTNGRSMRARTLFLMLILLAGADWLACRVLDQQVHRAFERWTQVMTDQGWAVHAGAVVEDGVPFGARLTLRDLSVTGGRAMVPGGVDLDAGRVVLSLAIADPFRLVIQPQGAVHLRLAGLPPVTVEAERMSASVKLWRTPVDSIDIRALSLAGGLQRSSNHQDVRVDSLHIVLKAARGFSARTTAQLTVDAHGAQLPDDGRWPLGATIGQIGFDLSLASPALSGGNGSDQARAWRDWGGALALQRLDVRWGPLQLHTIARLGLDDRLQPAGSGTAQVSGWGASLDALARGGAIAPGVAQTAKAVLGLMAPAASSSDGDATLSLPFTLRDSTLSVGKVPLMRLNTVTWGGV